MLVLTNNSCIRWLVSYNISNTKLTTERMMTVGLFKDYVSQTRKPEGFLGKLMLNGMNTTRS